MGTRYGTILVGGVVQTYNDGPPPDGGEQTEANRVKYSTITSDLSAPLHSAITSMDAKLLLQTDEGPLPKGISFTTTATEHNKVIECTSTITITLLTPTGNKGYQTTVKNAGTGVVTIDVSGGANIDGVASIILGEGDSVKAYVNDAETAYYTTAHGGLGIVATTKMLFYQAAAPTGWTIDAALDEHSVRLTSSIGGTKGGTNDFSTQFATLAEGATPGVGDHALNIAELAAHDHGGGVHKHNVNFRNQTGTENFDTGNYFALNADDSGATSLYMHSSTNSQNTVVIANSAATITSQGSGTAHGHTVDLRVKWAACIVATKD